MLEMTFTLGTLYLASEWVIRLAMLFYVPQRRSPAAARRIPSLAMASLSGLARGLTNGSRH